jgi:NitT/TauT family transport system ATP-binding protein
MALEDVTLEVRDGEFLSIVGPSGCGKTTLLRLIAGLLEPDTGRVSGTAGFEGQPLEAAMVYQDHGLFPWMTVLDNVAFGLERRNLPRKARDATARAYIERVGLGGFAGNYPHQLSAGMRQRVGIARALVSGAPVLLMDEPFGALDAQTKLVLQDDLLTTWREGAKLIVYVTHDIEEALVLGDRVLVMTGRPGRIREEIDVPFGRPRHRSIRDDPILTELKWHIWLLLEDEVRKSLAVS